VIVSSEDDPGVDVDAMDIKEVEQRKTREEKNTHTQESRIKLLVKEVVG